MEFPDLYTAQHKVHLAVISVGRSESRVLEVQPEHVYLQIFPPPCCGMSTEACCDSGPDSLFSTQHCPLSAILRATSSCAPRPDGVPRKLLSSANFRQEL